MNDVRPNVFVSACLEFEHCRFDGTMIADEYVKRMKDEMNLIRVCPELMIGLGAPREAVRLVEREGEDRKLLSSVHGYDYTAKMEAFLASYMEDLKTKDIDGFLLKAKSPTCGVGDVKVYRDVGKANLHVGRADGYYGVAIKEHYPAHPIETERRISNYQIRENFFIHIYTMARFRQAKASGAHKDLVRFHTVHKYLFMSYDQNRMTKLGRILANHEKLAFDAVVDLYESTLRELLHLEPSQKRRVNTLTHIYGYFKKELSNAEKEYYFDALDDYIDHRIPYSSVLYILKGFAVRFQQSYLLDQIIFEPFPKSLTLVMDSGNKI